MNRTVIAGLILVIIASIIQASVIWERYQDAINYVPRPGYCPVGVQGKTVDCGQGCRADQDCPDGGKCCPTACGRTCKTPVAEDPKQNSELRG
ncbi:WAP four-disulfide core domain protein 8-like [Liolophura sinensis]|uniref:WAP four-disulfide core domain protein 8-like n=1 Tax=Liolophura sinensis TaxID=3198878 RepID=UPI00315910CE